MNNVEDKINSVTVLGSGTSTGVPLVGCSCEVCTSPNIKDKRLRSSLFIQSASGKSFIVDTGPDLRAQLLRENITKCNAVIITHEHADHIMGLDDLKPLTFKESSPIGVYTHASCAHSLKNTFSYIFNEEQDAKKEIKSKNLLHKSRDKTFKTQVLGSGIPKLQLFALDLMSPDLQNLQSDRTPSQIVSQKILGEEFTFTLLPHGKIFSLSFRYKSLAYIIDCHQVTDHWLTYLKESNLEVLIIDCVRRKKHNTHLYLEKTLKYIKAIRPKRAFLTHLGHDFMHSELTKELSSKFGSEKIDVQVAFDGLKIHYH